MMWGVAEITCVRPILLVCTPYRTCKKSEAFSVVGMLLSNLMKSVNRLFAIHATSTENCNCYCIPSTKIYTYKVCIDDTPYVIEFPMNFLNNYYLGSLK